MDIFTVNVHSQSSSLYMPPLNSASSGINVKQSGSRIILHHKYMGMTADEDVRMIFGDQISGFPVILPGSAADVHHKHPMSLTLKALILRINKTDILAVAIPVHPYQRFERCDFISEIQTSAKIPRMPYLVYGGKKFLELRAEYAVSI